MLGVSVAGGMGVGWMIDDPESGRGVGAKIGGQFFGGVLGKKKPATYFGTTPRVGWKKHEPHSKVSAKQNVTVEKRESHSAENERINIARVNAKTRKPPATDETLEVRRCNLAYTRQESRMHSGGRR